MPREENDEGEIYATLTRPLPRESSLLLSVLLLFVLSFFPLSLISFLIIIRRTTPGPSQHVMEAMVSKMPTRTMDNIFRTPLGNTREPFSFKTN